MVIGHLHVVPRPVQHSGVALPTLRSSPETSVGLPRGLFVSGHTGCAVQIRQLWQALAQGSQEAALVLGDYATKGGRDQESAHPPISCAKTYDL